MFVRTTLVLLLLVSLLAPASSAVLCFEPDGRVEVEAGIGGRCADRVEPGHDGTPSLTDECGGCRDEGLPRAQSTASRKSKVVDEPCDALTASSVSPRPLAAETARPFETSPWLLVHREHVCVSTAVLLL